MCAWHSWLLWTRTLNMDSAYGLWTHVVEITWWTMSLNHNASELLPFKAVGEENPNVLTCQVVAVAHPSSDRGILCRILGESVFQAYRKWACSALNIENTSFMFQEVHPSMPTRVRVKLIWKAASWQAFARQLPLITAFIRAITTSRQPWQRAARHYKTNTHLQHI